MANSRVPMGNFHTPSPQGIYCFRKIGAVEGGIGIAYQASGSSVPVVYNHFLYSTSKDNSQTSFSKSSSQDSFTKKEGVG